MTPKPNNETMQVIIAVASGFCYGVRRAYKMTQDAIMSGGKVYMLGPLIHNPQVVAKLEEQGVKVVNNMDEVGDGALVIRSHGVSAEQLEAIRKSGVRTIDATCPNVQAVQALARSLSSEGYRVVVIGEVDHPEVQGVLSYVHNNEPLVIVDVDELGNQTWPEDKLGVVAQTTQDVRNFQRIVSQLVVRAREVRVFNTICTATFQRQAQARQLAREVDLMLVIGGKNSANTRRLAAISRKYQPRTRQVERLDEINPAWFEGTKKVGVTTGASTPGWLTEQVVQRIRELTVMRLEVIARKIPEQQQISGEGDELKVKNEALPRNAVRSGRAPERKYN